MEGNPPIRIFKPIISGSLKVQGRRRMGFRELLRKYGDWFRKFMLGLHKRDLERGGWLYRYGTPAAIFSLAYWAIFRVILEFQLISPRYLPHFVFTYLYIQLALGLVILAGFLRVAGKWWRYLLMVMLILTLAAIATITAILVFLP